jgi:hypothetical protein
MKPLFIHVPKAAGSSICDIVKQYNPKLKGCLHKKVSAYSVAYRSECFVFSFVRNPFDRLVSAHKYLTGGFGNKHDSNFAQTLSSDFKKFVFNDLNCNFNWLHFRPMFTWLNADIDFIGRFENFQQDFNFVCDKIGIPRQQLPHKNKSQHKHYTEYYDDETREIVAKKYARDIEHFGYEFGV